MSLLDNGSHTVLVYPEVTTTDSRGNPVKKPGDSAVVVTGCTLTPVARNRGRIGANACTPTTDSSPAPHRSDSGHE
jgi:hypothetical protein